MESQIIEKLKSQDQQAFRAFVETYQGKVFNTCLHFLRDTGEAEDITQEVFIEVFRSISKFRKESKLSTWIYKIATTKCLELQRYKKRKRRVAFFQSIIGIEDAKEYLEQKSVEYQHPGVQLEQKERAEALFKAIDGLPEAQSTAFVLHNIDGKSYKEISEIMDKSISSVESVIFRAKKNLRNKLGKMYRNEI